MREGGPTSDDVFSVESYKLPPEAERDALWNVFAKTRDPSANESLLRCLRTRVLSSASKALGVHKAFTTETSTDLAVGIMSGIASGRGIQVPLEAGFQDVRCADAPVLRPLREFSDEELAMYREHQGLCEIAPPLGFGAGNASIEGLTRNFILGLQENFPATVPTVFKTGDKFQVSEANRESLQGESTKCLLCGGILDTGLSESRPSAEEATEFSQEVSLKGPERLKDDELISGKKNCQIHQNFYNALFYRRAPEVDYINTRR